MVAPVSMPVESTRTVYNLSKMEHNRDGRHFGIVSHWNHTYGFIDTFSLDGKIYIHQSDCPQPLEVDAPVWFSAEFSEKHNKYRAFNCEVKPSLRSCIRLIMCTFCPHLETPFTICDPWGAICRSPRLENIAYGQWADTYSSDRAPSRCKSRRRPPNLMTPLPIQIALHRPLLIR